MAVSLNQTIGLVHGCAMTLRQACDEVSRALANGEDVKIPVGFTLNRRAAHELSKLDFVESSRPDEFLGLPVRLVNGPLDTLYATLHSMELPHETTPPNLGNFYAGLAEHCRELEQLLDRAAASHS